jgi:uncharacterized membrane protein YgcG
VFLSNFQSNGFAYDASQLVNTVAVSTTSNLQGRVIIGNFGTEASWPNTSVVYFTYNNTGTGGQTQFSNTDVLAFYPVGQTGNAAAIIAQVNVYANSNPNTFTVGTAHGIQSGTGVVYVGGTFVQVDTPQYALINSYATWAGNCVAGFVVNTAIVTPDTDPTLLDNALGYPNYNAPGAYRLQVTATLVGLDPVVAADTAGFNPVAWYNYGSLVNTETPSDNIQSQIGAAIAQQLYNEAGNFVVNPFTVDTISYNPNPVVQTDPSVFYARVGTGSGYAQGSFVRNQKTSYVAMRRGTDATSVLDQQTTFNYPGYAQVNQVAGVFPFSNASSVSLYDTPQQAVANRTFAGLTPAGNIIGSAKLRCFSYLSGTPGTGNAAYFLHLFDVQMGNAYTPLQVKSIYYNGASKGVADVAAPLTSSAYQLFPTGATAMISLRDSAMNNNVEYTYRKYAAASMDLTGNVSVTLTSSAPGGTDLLPYGAGTLTDSEASTFTLVIEQLGASASLAGTVTVYNTNTAMVGAGTAFSTTLAVGDLIQVGAAVRTVTAITNATFLTVDSAYPANAASQAYNRYYEPGQIVPVFQTMPGRSITVSNSTNFTIHTGLAPTGSLNCTVYFDVLRTHAVPAAKVINKNRFVTINAVATPNGPWSLGFVDVHDVNGIWGTSNGVYGTSGANLMSMFAFDTGQRDDRYDVATLSLKPGATTASYPYITVCLDYFTVNTTAGIDFFTVESYPIDDVNSANNGAIQTTGLPLYVDSGGTQVSLRDTVDFRPYGAQISADTGNCNIANSAQTATSVAMATNNPGNTLTLAVSSYGLNVPSYTRNMQADYTFFLPRYDLIYFTPTGLIKVKEGRPSLEPQTPLYPDSGMALAVLTIPPYPSLTSDEIGALTDENSMSVNLIRDTSPIILSQVVTNRRYTMADIGTLDTRIGDLEYYASLTLLQQNASDLTVTDANGLDRFKNGIFVDPFSDFTFSDVSNPGYSIAIDESIGVARPRIRRETVMTRYNDGASVNCQKTGRVLTLPYVSVPWLSQPYATIYQTCAPGIWMWAGQMQMCPSYDCHTDYTQTGSINVTVNLAGAWQQFANTFDGAFYGSWRTTAPPTSNTGGGGGGGGSSPPANTGSGSSGGGSCGGGCPRTPPCQCPPELSNCYHTRITNCDTDTPCTKFTRGNCSYTWSGGNECGSIPTHSDGSGACQYSDPNSESNRI